MAGKKKVTKKGGKKGGKKKDKKEAEGGEGAPELSVLDKNYYLTQIQALERTSDRVNQRCDQLSNAEKHAREQYRSLHQEKVDIVSFLRESLTSREDEIEELRSRLGGLMKAKEAERVEYEDKLKRLRQESERTKADLSDQILSLTRKLESLEEFRLQKEELESEHALLQATLKNEREEHQEKISMLERSLIEESAALKKDQEEKLVKITEELREAARREMHQTTRTALTENEALTKILAAIKSKVIKFHQENLALRNELSDQRIREVVLQDSLVQMTSTAERRAKVLTRVVEKAEEHSRIFKEYEVLQEEKEKLRRDLQQVQIQLDAATKMTCELRESSSEKAVALEQFTTRLQEERTRRKRVTVALNSALKLLQESIFADSEDSLVAFENMRTQKGAISNVILTQLVEILSGAEQHVPLEDEKEEKSEKGDRRVQMANSEPLVTYSAGDLGLVPKKVKGRQKSQ